MEDDGAKHVLYHRTKSKNDIIAGDFTDYMTHVQSLSRMSC